jgi:hypothetical protein
MQHQSSDSHNESVEKLGNCTREPISVQLDSQILAEQKLARTSLQHIFSCVKFLSQQGFPFRAHEHHDGAFINLMKEKACFSPEVAQWMTKRKNWLSDTIQNEIVEIVSHNLLRTICLEIQSCDFIGLVADGTTDVSGTEQLSICVQYASNDFEIKNMFIGFYNPPDTKAVTITKCIKDVLLRQNIPLSFLHGCAFDGAANMSGQHTGVKALLNKDCPDALFIHCANHSLDLVLQEVTRSVRLVAECLQFVRDSANFIRESPKRRQLFQESFDDNTPAISLQALCPTRWCVRYSAISRILDHYQNVERTLLTIKSEKSNHGDVKARAAGLHKQCIQSKIYFALLVCKRLFGECEECARMLQGSNVTAKAVNEAINVLLKSLERMRSESLFNEILTEVRKKSSHLNLQNPLPKRFTKTPGALRHDGKSIADEEACWTYEDKWRRNYYEVLDLVTAELKRRFDQKHINTAIARENLLISEGCCDEDIQNARLPRKIDIARLRRQLFQLHDLAAAKKVKIDSIACVQNLILSVEPITRTLFSEVQLLMRLILCLPVSAASAERSFSSLRRLKTWTRSTMTQKRTTHLALLFVHRELVENLSWTQMMEEFVSRSTERRSTFGCF